MTYASGNKFENNIILCWPPTLSSYTVCGLMGERRTERHGTRRHAKWWQRRRCRPRCWDPGTNRRKWCVRAVGPKVHDRGQRVPKMSGNSLVSIKTGAPWTWPAHWVPRWGRSWSIVVWGESMTAVRGIIRCESYSRRQGTLPHRFAVDLPTLKAHRSARAYHYSLQCYHIDSHCSFRTKSTGKQY